MRDPCRGCGTERLHLRARRGDDRARRIAPYFTEGKKARVCGKVDFRRRLSQANLQSHRSLLLLLHRPARTCRCSSATMATTVSAPGAGAFKPLDDDAKSKVKAQMEFYFSDSNLPRDKFLRETVEADPDGFVDIQLLATFSRMRSLLAAFGGAHNDETIGAVVELLKTSTELTVSDDGKRVRRTAVGRLRARRAALEVGRDAAHEGPAEPGSQECRKDGTRGRGQSACR